MAVPERFRRRGSCALDDALDGGGPRAELSEGKEPEGMRVQGSGASASSIRAARAACHRETAASAFHRASLRTPHRVAPSASVERALREHDVTWCIECARRGYGLPSDHALLEEAKQTALAEACAEEAARLVKSWFEKPYDGAVKVEAKIARLEAEHRELVEQHRKAARTRIVERVREQQHEQERRKRGKFEQYKAGTYVGDMLRREEAQQAEAKRVRSLTPRQREAERNARTAAELDMTVEEYVVFDVAFRAARRAGLPDPCWTDACWRQGRVCSGPLPHRSAKDGRR